MRAVLLAVLACVPAGCTEPIGTPSSVEAPDRVIELELRHVASICARPAGGCSSMTEATSFDAYHAAGEGRFANVTFTATWNPRHTLEEELRFRLWHADGEVAAEFASTSPASRQFSVPIGKDFAISFRPEADPAAALDLRVQGTLEGPIRGPKPLS